VVLKLTCLSFLELSLLSLPFLSCPSVADVRPGLLHKREDRRRHEMLKRKQAEEEESRKKRPKPAAERMAEGLKAGLNTPIASDNKGFQLLAKMGYKPGTSLGKPVVGNNEDGGDDGRLKEPVPIVQKKDRQCLGQNTKYKEKMEEVKQRQIRHEQFTDTKAFRHRSQEASAQKLLQKDVRTAQIACMNLDGQNEKVSPIELWYWPEKVKEVKDKTDIFKTVADEGNSDTEEEDEEDRPEPGEILKDVTDYLRKEYLYCIWCGNSYESLEDLQANCPGNSRDEH